MKSADSFFDKHRGRRGYFLANFHDCIEFNPSVPFFGLNNKAKVIGHKAEGTNILVGTEPGVILAEACNILDGGGKTVRGPAPWYGRAAERILQQLRGLV